MAKTEFCIIGLSKFGSQVAERLTTLNRNIMVMDKNSDVIAKANNMYEVAIKCDCTDINALNTSGIKNVKTVIVGTSDVNASILICANLKELGIDNIIATATNVVHERVLKVLGVPKVVIPEIEIANRTAIQCIYNLSADITGIGNNLSWIKTVITNNDIIDKTVIELKLKDHYDANVILVQRRDKTIFPITKDTKFKIGDIVTVICHNDKIRQIVELLSKHLI